MKIYFCEKCGVSIPLQEVVGGRATARDGKTYCQTCNPESAASSEDLKLYFCDNCRVSIPLQDVITSRAKTEGDTTHCADCSRLTFTQRSARKERIEKELKEKEESRYRLHFCDRCNTSIPQSHLIIGRAVVRGGRTFCERCKGRSERRKVSAFTTVLGILVLAIVFVGGYALLGPGKALLAGSEGSGNRVARDDDLRQEILRAVRDSLDVERKAVEGRFDELTGLLDALNRKAATLKESFENLSEMSGETLVGQGELRGEMERRLATVEASFRDARQKLAALGERIEELKNRPAGAAPRVPAGSADEPAAEPAASLPAEPAPTPEPVAPPEVKQWIADLEDDDPGVRFSAAVELGRSGFKGAAGPLGEVLKKDKDMFVRRAAARSLGDLAAWKAIPVLIDTLEDRDYFVAVTAHTALEKITREDFGFRENLSRSEVRKVVSKARRWWEEHKDEFSD